MINPQLLFKLASPMPSPDRQTLGSVISMIVIIRMIVITTDQMETLLFMNFTNV